MSSISLDTLVLAKKYTDKVLSGLGELKGSPCTIKATKENDDGSITVTFAWTGSDGVEETQDVIIPAGPQGTQGEQGEKGTDGTNGVSPTVTITEIEDGHTITITDAGGTQSFNVLNGADGNSTFTNKAVLDGITSEKVADWDEAVTTKTALETHIETGVYGETGVHGFRYYNDTLQVQNEDNEWIDIETGGSGGGGTAPNNVSDINLKTGNTKLTITWSDPSDTIIEGQTLSTWKGTKLVQKVGSFPENPKDGTLILDNQTRDKYKTSGFEVTGLTNGETYYFALFPYSDTGAVNTNVANRISGTPQAYRKMTAIIDLSNSNPATSVTYADDAEKMTAKSSDWDDFFGHYPVLLKNGVEVGKLNRNNFAQFEDGSAADITSGNAGDVMIAFPRRGVKISTSGNILTISMTDDPDNSDFTYYAHTRGTTRKEVFYLGAYKGYVASLKLRSLSGKTPTASQTIGTFRTQAHTNGTGYELSGFYQLIFRQCMYLLKYKNLDSQSALGKGYVEGIAAVNTGATNTMGMDYGTTSTPTQMKLFGLEDFWGNIWEWIDGIVTDSTRNILTATDSFNDSGSGYKNQGQGATSNIGGYMSKPQGKSETGFLAKEVNGSTTTYFCDYAYLCDSCAAFFGGRWGNDDATGAFRLDMSDAASFYGGGVAARLMFL